MLPQDINQLLAARRLHHDLLHATLLALHHQLLARVVRRECDDVWPFAFCLVADFNNFPGRQETIHDRHVAVHEDYFERHGQESLIVVIGRIGVLLLLFVLQGQLRGI